VIYPKTRKHAETHVTSGALSHSALPLAARRTLTATQVGPFCWPLVVMRLLLRLASPLSFLFLLNHYHILLLLHLLLFPSFSSSCSYFSSRPLPTCSSPASTFLFSFILFSCSSYFLLIFFSFFALFSFFYF